MKTLFKTQKPKTRTRLINEELSETIKSTDSLLIAKHLKQAQKLAQMDFSKLKEKTSIKSFLGGMKSDYQKLVDKIDQTLAGPLSEFQSNQDIEEAKIKLVEINDKIKEIETKLSYFKAKLNEDFDKLKARVEGWLNRKLIILYIISGLEVVGNYSIFFLFGGGLFSALAISIISAVVLFWWAHVTPRYVKKLGGESNWKQVLLFLVFSLPVLVLVYFLADVRVLSLIAENPEMENVYVTNPILLILINFLGYLVSCFIVYLYKPNKNDIESFKKHKSDTKIILNFENQREALIERRSALRPELQQRLRDHYNFLLLGNQLENEVVTSYEGCYDEFKYELYLRTNSDCDPLFKGKEEDLPPLRLRYQNIDPKKFELCDTDLS